MRHFGLIIITVAITSIVMTMVFLGASLLYLASEDEVLVITQTNGIHGEYTWMSKGYLEKRNESMRYSIPTKRVLVMFE